MVNVVFIIAVLNFALGYALAIYLKRMQQAALLRAVAAVPVAEPIKIEIPSSRSIKKEKEPEPEPEPEPVIEELPEEWLSVLEEEAVVAGSFVEASVQVLRLEVGKYRASLIKIEDQVRQCEQTLDKETLNSLLDELKLLNEDWLGKQNEAVGHLQSRSGGLGDFQEMGNSLEDVLLEQAAQIETTCNNLAIMDFETDVVSGCHRLIEEICRLVDLAHSLRDNMQESLVTIMHAEKKLEEMDRRLQFDGLTTLHSRTGLEVILYEWWRDDIGRQRTVSVAMVDIDHMGKINGRYGTKVGGQLLGTFGPLLDDLIRKDRGFDMATRYAGEQFVLFFGDTGPRNAMSAAERIRQTIEATSFEYNDIEIELTVSCGVTEIAKNDNSRVLFKRLYRTLREAKKLGRNRTCLDEGNGPQVVEAPEFQVKGRVVRLHDE